MRIGWPRKHDPDPIDKQIAEQSARAQEVLARSEQVLAQREQVLMKAAEVIPDIRVSERNGAIIDDYNRADRERRNA